MRQFILSLLCAALPFISSAQSNPFIGARANGMGYASSSLNDVWSIFNNPAGLADLQQTNFAVTYDTDPAFTPFNRMAIAFSSFMGKSGFGVGIFRFGDGLLNEQTICAGYANRFGITSLGVKVNYIQFSTENMGSKGALSFTIGGITEITPWLNIGAQIINVNQPDLTRDEKVPAILTLNAAIKASQKVSIVMEAEKNMTEKPLIKAGIEYRMREKIFLRTGFHPYPTTGFFGFGFHLKKIEFDYAFTYQMISSRHQVSFQYSMKKAK